MEHTKDPQVTFQTVMRLVSTSELCTHSATTPIDIHRYYIFLGSDGKRYAMEDIMLDNKAKEYLSRLINTDANIMIQGYASPLGTVHKLIIAAFAEYVERGGCFFCVHPETGEETGQLYPFE